MRFSERQGHKSVRSVIQIDSMDDPLRNSLWNVLQSVVWDSHRDRGNYSYTLSSSLDELFRSYWADYFKIPIDRIPTYVGDAIKSVRGYFFECKWYEVYDFMEFTAGFLKTSRARFIEISNRSLEREVSGYRFVGEKIVPISSKTELDAIGVALHGSGNNAGARMHLKRALELLSDRQSPDYRNSIKESISAVEAVVVGIAGDSSATLGVALKAISQHAPIHPALNRSLTALYGYTSDSDGIRHALLDEPNLDFIDAKFMLVACAAFVNYIRAKAEPPQQS